MKNDLSNGNYKSGTSRKFSLYFSWKKSRTFIIISVELMSWVGEKDTFISQTRTKMVIFKCMSTYQTTFVQYNEWEPIIFFSPNKMSCQTNINLTYKCLYILLPHTGKVDPERNLKTTLKLLRKLNNWVLMQIGENSIHGCLFKAHEFAQNCSLQWTWKQGLCWWLAMYLYAIYWPFYVLYSVSCALRILCIKHAVFGLHVFFFDVLSA